MDARDIIGYIMVLTIVGILGGVSIYINEKVADKTALSCLKADGTAGNKTADGYCAVGGNTTGDTYYNSSINLISTVETGWDFTEIVILAVAAGLIIAAIFGVIGGFIRI